MNVYRYEVPVDNRWHEIELSGPVLHVASRHGDARLVHFWAVNGQGLPYLYRFRVFGTGMEIPGSADYTGTAICEPYVWHLFRQAVSVPL